MWLATAAMAMGCSIWSMHFVAMVGFDPGAPVRYDAWLTVLSLLLAVGATGGAFVIAAREGARRVHLVAAGFAMGVGICLMHYVGMAALRTAVSLGYEPALVALSLVVAVAASTAALFAARLERSLSWRAAAAAILGAAIVGMHYTAMAALRLTAVAGQGAEPVGAPPFVLAVSVACGTVLILFLALMASLYDQRGNILSALEAGGVGYWELDLRSAALHVSTKGKEILGLPGDAELTYEGWTHLLAPEERARREQLLQTAIRTGEDYDAEYRLADQARWVNIRGRSTFNAAGAPVRMIGVVLDVSDRHEAFAAVSASEARQRLLINELNHRVKNTLATIQSIADQTARRSTSLEGFRASFEARIIALSATHNVLTRSGWEGAGLREILLSELQPYGEERVRLRGAEVELEARQALALGMVFHELATNAAKYGALSNAKGVVTVTWSVDLDARRTLEIGWRESGGPQVAVPLRRGFGSRLIQGGVGQELGGEVALDYAPEGFCCTLRVPLSDGASAAAARPFAF